MIQEADPKCFSYWASAEKETWTRVNVGKHVFISDVMRKLHPSNS